MQRSAQRLGFALFLDARLFHARARGLDELQRLFLRQDFRQGPR